MNAWEKYESRMKAVGQTKRDMVLNHSKMSIARRLQDSLAFHSVLIDGAEQDVGIIKKADLSVKTIVAMPGERLRHGGLVDYEDHKWLITELDASKEVYERGIMQQCNYILKWKRKDTGEIVNRWCIVEDGTKYLTGERSEQMMTVGDARISITISKDEETANISRGMRFLIDDPDASTKHVYQVTKLNRLFNLYNSEGVYRFILTEDHLTDRDNTELMVADYYESVQNSQGGSSDQDATESGWL